MDSDTKKGEESKDRLFKNVKDKWDQINRGIVDAIHEYEKRKEEEKNVLQKK